uniref:Uncharacterized protein n=1 Tax=Knipowitschia caucasica TaxID=637954 RepID=A0AAV2JHW7_KNICA
MEPLQRVTSDQDSRLQDQRTQSVTDSKFLQNSSQFALQDSNLSPALSLLPSESGLDHNIDFSLFQRSDREFAPLSACLDISVASETFQIPPHEEKTSEQHKDKIDTEELDSSNSGNKVATSIGTSSISLEVDNYDPYWTGKASTPPPQHKPRELNIEERIPLYLQNLGINQSPSTILTPFAPRGPIREPEFSPTELGTIKGSTPTKSIQPSEDGTPHKAEFSRSSSDSVLTTRERLTGGEIVQPARQSGVVSRSAGLSLVLNKSVQRSEPEGCSAAPPDQVQVQLSPLAAAIETTVPEESKEAVLETSKDSPVQSSISSPAPLESLSDSSSQSSLAIRVAKLLQTESPATMVSSTNSVDQEEGRAREWIKLMISGQKCEPLELDQEDRRRIEEIKSELLLKNPKLFGQYRCLVKGLCQHRHRKQRCIKSSRPKRTNFTSSNRCSQVQNPRNAA